MISQKMNIKQHRVEKHSIFYKMISGIEDIPIEVLGYICVLSGTHKAKLEYSSLNLISRFIMFEKVYSRYSDTN